MKRIDDYLTGKAAATWPGAIVHEEAGYFVLERPDQEDVLLAGPPTYATGRFRAARATLKALRQQWEAEHGPRTSR